MTKTLGIIIGSGGTGAKVAEAFVHATAAGLGPQRLLVGLVDQDGGNGNTSRALQTVQAYAEARRLWRGEGGHRLGNDSELLLPEIGLVSPGDPIWVPHPDGNTTLDTAVGQRDLADQALFDALFERGANEQQMPFEVGYRARPNVGALAMALAMEDRSQAFVRGVVSAIQSAGQGWSVRLVVAGSIFGGTGAAGLPTLARLLKRAVPANFAGLVRMGGILMLPYFSFDPPPEDKSAFADPNQFLASSRAAIAYYRGLQVRGQLPYDKAYAVGWDPLFVADGDFAEGGSRQRNAAMPPELVAALAACRFCADADPPGPTVSLVPRDNARALSWTDLPSPDPDALTPFYRLGHLLRFGLAWPHWNSVIDVDSSRRFGFGRHAFFKTQGLDRVDWKKAPPQSERDALSRWTELVLEWARMQAATSQLNGIDFKLWRAPPASAALDGSDLYANSLDELLCQPDASPPPRAVDINKMLSIEPGPASATGLGRVAAQLYRATAVTA